MADKKSEAAEIKRIGATAQKNSGRGAHHKGDAILEPFLVDIKEYSKSYALNKANWAKICMDAVKRDKRQPALNVVLGDEGEPRVRLWVVGERMFEEMREAWLEKYESMSEMQEG